METLCLRVFVVKTCRNSLTAKSAKKREGDESKFILQEKTEITEKPSSVNSVTSCAKVWSYPSRASRPFRSGPIGTEVCSWRIFQVPPSGLSTQVRRFCMLRSSVPVGEIAA
jgi:hypothetical protein